MRPRSSLSHIATRPALCLGVSGMSARSAPTPSREWTYVYVPVALNGARRMVATISAPVLIVGSLSVASV